MEAELGTCRYMSVTCAGECAAAEPEPEPLSAHLAEQEPGTVNRPAGPANEISFLSDLYNDKHTVVKRAVRSSLFYTQLHQALTQSRETLTTTAEQDTFFH